MKIVCAGASGSGKTTLAKLIAESLNLKFMENSAGLIMLPEDREHLLVEHDYPGGGGQVNVINLSHHNPSFGVDFQLAILKARTHILAYNDNLALDRSPLDALVFYLNQCVHNFSKADSEEFINRVAYTLHTSGITHIIRIPLLNPDNWVEDNGSRCSNWFFQKKIDSLFDLALDLCQEAIKKTFKFHRFPPIALYRVNTWDLNERLERTLEFIERYTPSKNAI